MTSRRPRAPHSLHQSGSPADVLDVSEMGLVTEKRTTVKQNVAKRVTNKFEAKFEAR